MSAQSAKPYFLRALWEWCGDEGYTPHLLVKVDAQTRVPRGYVKDGVIVLNLSAAATNRLTINNDWIMFSARFSGVSQEISVPMAAVMGIFAKETGFGMDFSQQSVEESEPGIPAEATSVGPPPATDVATPTGQSPEPTKPARDRSHLQVIK